MKVNADKLNEEKIERDTRIEASHQKSSACGEIESFRCSDGIGELLERASPQPLLRLLFT